MHSNRTCRAVLPASLLCVAFAVTTPAGAADAGAQAACEALGSLKIPAAGITLPSSGAAVTSAAFVAAGAAGNAHGEYCRVLGAILPVDKAAPQIRWRVNLPANWNGKALQMGGGGYNGSIPDTLSKPKLGLDGIPSPLAQG